MADDNDPEKKRLELDRERLLIEKSRLHIEREKLYLERYRTDVAPMETFDLENSKAAAAMAQMTIRTLFLLNGGAFVAWPSLQKMFEGTAILEDLKLSLVAHGSGVLATVTASVFAFLALEAGAFRASAERDVRAMVRNKAYVEEGPPDPNAKAPTVGEIATAKNLRDRHGRHARLYRNIALFVVVLSCLAFVGGATLGAIGFFVRTPQ